MAGASSAALAPGSMLGVMGGGQLAKMFLQAAQAMGYRVAVFAEEADAPAAACTAHAHVGSMRDPDAVARFARACDVVSFEFEHIPEEALAVLDGEVACRPRPDAIRLAQHRLEEKAALRRLGMPLAPYEPVPERGRLDAARRSLDADGVLKRAVAGYDGKGQTMLPRDGDADTAWAAVEPGPAVLERRIDFDREFSVIVARGASGEVACYDPVANDHDRHILDVSASPASLHARATADGMALARKLIEGLDYVGVLCVEFFALPDGSVLVNEIAPRPHNSGHLTIEGCETSQFGQQVRAAAGLPLGSTRRRGGGAAMANLLGDLWSDGEPQWAWGLREPGVSLHLYGKTEARPGRKMGHLTAVAASPEEARSRVLAARRALRGR